MFLPNVCAVMLAGGIAVFGAGDVPAAPKINKQRFETYVRYTEGLTSVVKLEIDDPTPPTYEGYFRLIVHFVVNGNRVADKLYYVTADGERFLNGSVWSLHENPFQDTLNHLPTDGPAFGPTIAKVTMVVFSDFQCPYCREFAKTLRDNLQKKYAQDVRVVFKNFPLETIHPWARAAAEAGACVAGEQPEAFWAFHDWIFEHQQEVTAANLKEKTLAFAKEHTVDEAKLSSCIDTHATGKQVEESENIGRRLQIQQTPTSFINGRMMAGDVAWTQLDAVIQLELNRPKEIPGPAAEKCCEVNVPAILKR